jgi:DNA polymerase-3 subunit delta
MRLKAEQLGSTLKKNLSAIYFISGDEPLQLGEAADAIRLTAKTNGYSAREIHSVETGFVWNELTDSANSLSIFADKKLIDLRMKSAKPGIEGAKVLTHYCQNLQEDTLLLITSPKLEKSALKSKWFQAIEEAGVTIQVWPLEGAGLIQWLQLRSKKRGLQIELDGIKALASRVEGNLLAAAQEIEKLYILHGTTQLSKKTVEDAVADNARFDVFKLTDSLLSGRANRAIKIINGLKAESSPAPVVLWAITREIRLLINIQTGINQGQNKETVFKNMRVWDKRKQLINAALSRMEMDSFRHALTLSSKADRQIKGQETGDCWETLISICLSFCR